VRASLRRRCDLSEAARNLHFTQIPTLLVPRDKERLRGGIDAERSASIRDHPAGIVAAVRRGHRKRSEIAQIFGLQEGKSKLWLSEDAMGEYREAESDSDRAHYARVEELHGNGTSGGKVCARGLRAPLTLKLCADPIRPRHACAHPRVLRS